jgi:hypothetical protein
MSHKQHKNCHSGDHSSDHSEKCGQCFDQRACIICPPCDHHEKYESSRSDSSCPDFADLCEDKPKICCEKKNLCKKDHKKKSCSSSSSSSSSSSESCSSESDFSKPDHRRRRNNGGCRGCDKQCNKCARCRACGCKECSDFSRTSVISAFGSSSDSECPRFDHIADDKKQKCHELVSPCKKSHHVEETAKKVEEPKKQAVTAGKATKVEIKTETAKVEAKTEVKKEVAKLSDMSVKGSVTSSSKGKKFIISFKSKEVHPWAEYNEGDSSIHINGKNGPVLHLYRNCTYFFCVEQDIPECDDPEHTFVLTNSPAGGMNSRIIPNGFVPVSKGCVCFKVDKCTPRYFFYQDSKNAYSGGLVIVHDK